MASDATALAIDTAAAQCAVALVSGDRAIKQAEPMARGHAERLFPMIEAVLAEAGAGYGDLDRIVCATGPGSFAGTRIGVAAARGLALGIGRPAVGVTRFAALAAEARGANDSAVAAVTAVTVVIAGRGGQAFLQTFDGAGRPLDAPEMIGANASEPPGIALVAGDGMPGWQRCPRVLADGLGDPAVLARLGLDIPPGEPPAPLYLRPPDVHSPREGPPRLLA